MAIPDNTIVAGKGFIIFWADGYDEIPGHRYLRSWGFANFGPYFTTIYHHLNFKLSRAGEEIALFDPSGVLVDSVSFEEQTPNISCGRNPDNNDEWVYYDEPTPAKINSTTKIENIIAATPPTFSQNGGFYDTPQIISITNNRSGTIKYTTDGSIPSRTSVTYFEPIAVDTTTIIRARSFEEGNIPSEIITNSYFINETHSLPVISISTNPELLWHDTTGIYQNELKERKIPVVLEFFDQNNGEGFKLDAGLQLTGQWSYTYPQKPFTINADDKYGEDFIDYQLFSDRKLNSFKSIYLRNGGSPDNFNSYIRDALIHSLVINKMDLDCQAYKPAALYLNGDYWGLYNIREKTRKNYFSSHHNVNPDNLDILEFSGSKTPEIMAGDLVLFDSLKTLLSSEEILDDSEYGKLEKLIDIDEYLNYLITQIYCDNVNWQPSNVRFWREKKESGKFRWMLIDCDMGFGIPSVYWSTGYNHNALKRANTKAWSYSSSNNDRLPAWSTLQFRRLLEKDTFKNEFIQRFAAHLNTTFHEDQTS